MNRDRHRYILTERYLPREDAAAGVASGNPLVQLYAARSHDHMTFASNQAPYVHQPAIKRTVLEGILFHGNDSANRPRASRAGGMILAMHCRRRIRNDAS